MGGSFRGVESVGRAPARQIEHGAGGERAILGAQPGDHGGHLLGGAGAIEAMFTVLALHNRLAPPTINLDNQDPEIKLDVVTSPRELPEGDILAISNSFGFGGHNAVVAFRSYN